MKLSDYLETEGITAAELSRRLGISKAAISKWDEIPDKWLGMLITTPLHPYPSATKVYKDFVITTKGYKDFQKRVVQELDDLEVRISGLSSFVGSEAYSALYQAERTRLTEQLEAMNRYADILKRMKLIDDTKSVRIEGF